jgi:uncharacterized protein (DUF433 family)
MRVTTRRLVREFQRGLSFVGLARKFGLTRHQIEERVRRWMRAHPWSAR